MNKLDMPSFYAGMFLGLFLLTFVIFMNSVLGDYYVIQVHESCNYAEDMCYPEYDSEGWHIIEGER